MDHKQPIVTRFAPSPTGFLHIGGVRTAIFAWLYARQHGGQFILRIEDTDKEREVEGSIQHIIDSLTWIGLDWDYGPGEPSESFGSCLQSDRLAQYHDYAIHLLDKGLAYPDPYTTDEVQTFRAQAQAEKRPFLFRDHRPHTFMEWDGTQPLRFKVPEIKRSIWHDVVRGELSAGEEMLDDFIILKADGYPTYNFAHIIDDQVMGITHVMRGEEFISSTPKFLSLIDALEFDRPTFVTLPPILGPDGKKKLSKRDGAKDILEYATEGYLPEAMLNFLALIGWNPGVTQEIFTKQELIEQFSLNKIQRSGGVFNVEKLTWMNKAHLHRKSLEEKISYVQSAVPDLPPDQAAKLTPTILERTHTKTAIVAAIGAGEYDWVHTTPDYESTLLKWKHDPDLTTSANRLQYVASLLQTADFSSPSSIKAAIWEYAEEAGRGEVLWPLRVALSGQERSPDPFTLAYVLGKAETLHRIARACDKIKA
jgi:glutamyl-tRNA synthetase